jgi:hypothetical protein
MGVVVETLKSLRAWQIGTLARATCGHRCRNLRRLRRPQWLG